LNVGSGVNSICQSDHIGGFSGHCPRVCLGLNIFVGFSEAETDGRVLSSLAESYDNLSNENLDIVGSPCSVKGTAVGHCGEVSCPYSNTSSHVVPIGISSESGWITLLSPWTCGRTCNRRSFTCWTAFSGNVRRNFVVGTCWKVSIAVHNVESWASSLRSNTRANAEVGVGSHGNLPKSTKVYASNVGVDWVVTALSSGWIEWGIVCVGISSATSAACSGAECGIIGSSTCSQRVVVGDTLVKLSLGTWGSRWSATQATCGSTTSRIHSSGTSSECSLITPTSLKLLRGTPLNDYSSLSARGTSSDDGGVFCGTASRD